MADTEAKILTINKILTAAPNGRDAFPKTIAKGVWGLAMKGSVAQRLAGSIPVALNGTAIPIPVGQPTAGIVAEGAAKPVGELGAKVKTVQPIKTALIIIYSMETAQADPLGEYSRIQATLAEGIARAIDTAVIYGIDANTGTAITGQESLSATTLSQEIDLASTKPNYLTDALVDAYSKVTVGTDYSFSSFLLSEKFRAPLAKAADSTGRPLYQDAVNLAAEWTRVMGLPATFSKAVDGYEKAKTPATKVLGFGGDFKDALRLGFVENITFRRASEYAAGIDLFGRNLGAILAEAQFGFALRDPAAFVKLTSK